MADGMVSGRLDVRSVSGIASITGLAALTIGVCLIAAAVVQASDVVRTTMPVTVPQVEPEPLWEEQRRVFAQRLVRSFRLDESVATEFADWILEAARRQDLDPVLLASVVRTESNFRKRARSSTGAFGPAQVRPDLWGQFCGGDVTDPEQNVYCGAVVLGHYREKCIAGGEFGGARLIDECALRAYNLGFENRNSVYFIGAANRYLAKIDRFQAQLRAADAV